ncbi:MAG TPA: cytochrome c oxidase subunit II [Solirubrobacteraceae bacterium]|jgi:cytochrome c oxidase subunit 2|nr:cytochrome c oxidase subunit II [Solirubrobacteraceae bacterium]
MGTRHEYDRVAGLYLPIAAAVFALVVVVLAALLWRYRAAAGRATGGPSEMPRLEGAWIALVVAVVVVLLVVTLRAESHEDAVARDPALVVGVLAAKWSWRFDYPGGVSTRDELVVPAGRTVRFDAVSLDVLHDLWVPGLRFQRQVWPDHHERFDLYFGHAGTYGGKCAWFCGLGHDSMTFTVRALAPAAFDRWLAARGRAAA